VTGLTPSERRKFHALLDSTQRLVETYLKASETFSRGVGTERDVDRLRRNISEIKRQSDDIMDAFYDKVAS